jgi:Right handed beta helix region
MPLDEAEKEARKDYKVDMQQYYIQKDSPSVVYLASGTLYMDKCKIRIRRLGYARAAKIPAIICFQNSFLKLVGCEITGTYIMSTAGIVSYMANIGVSSCKIKDNFDGGILLSSSEKNKIKISSSEIRDNKLCGIYCEGTRASPLINRCRIDGNEGAGIICNYGTCTRVINSSDK